jgi:hypothetical protein
MRAKLYASTEWFADLAKPADEYVDVTRLIPAVMIPSDPQLHPLGITEYLNHGK